MVIPGNNDSGIDILGTPRQFNKAHEAYFLKSKNMISIKQGFGKY